MSTPFPGASAPGPQKGRKNWLLRILEVQTKYDSLIATALDDAAEDAYASILRRIDDKRIGSTVRRSQLRLAAQAAKRSVSALFSNVRPIVASGLSDAAVAAAEAGFVDDNRILRRMFGDKRGIYEEAMRQSASRGAQAMMARVLLSHKPLSERVYKTQALANGSIDRIVNSALVKGDSAIDIAKAVRSSIRPDTPGGIGYAAKRLGRTEINNAFHAQSIGQVQEKPWVDRVEWRLSKVHEPQGCKCETYARLKTFNKDEIPEKPHPQCMCYFVPVLIDWNTFEQNLIAGIYNGYIDDNL